MIGVVFDAEGRVVREVELVRPPLTGDGLFERAWRVAEEVTVPAGGALVGRYRRDPADEYPPFVTSTKQGYRP